MATIIKDARNIEFHYYIANEKHSMDAKLLNECNKDVLQIIDYLLKEFGYEIKIETLALSEGGIRQIWKLIGKNGTQLQVILGIITLLMVLVPQKKELSDLEKTNLKLQNEKLGLEIKKLKSESDDKEILKDEEVTQISNTVEVDTNRSKFYKKLENNPEVEKIEITIQDENYVPVFTQQISRNQFIDYVLVSEELPDEIDDNAEVHIIAPILIDKKYKWKGLYKNEVIDFFVNDSSFKEDINECNITFQAGTKIEGKLSTRRKFEENGKIKITSVAIEEVYSVVSADNVFVTLSGKKKKRNLKDERDQGRLDF